MQYYVVFCAEAWEFLRKLYSCRQLPVLFFPEFFFVFTFARPTKTPSTTIRNYVFDNTAGKPFPIVKPSGIASPMCRSIVRILVLTSVSCSTDPGSLSGTRIVRLRFGPIRPSHAVGPLR